MQTSKGALGSVSEEHKSKRYIIVFLNLSFVLSSSVFLMTCFRSSGSLVLTSYKPKSWTNQQNCSGLLNLDDYKAKCSLLKSNNPCVSQGYVDYLYLFYCNFGEFQFLGHSLLILWLLILFYLLGNTASEYFCYSLESLSCFLKLSPTLAGVTLLPLGNGAPDVFSSMVSFMDGETQDVALNTVLGGALFVTCVVVGTISTFVRRKEVRINKQAFVRDVCFLLLVLFSLTLILVYGRITIWGSMAFSLMYIVYVILVYIVYIVWNSGATDVFDSDSCGLKKPILNGIEKVETECLEGGNMEDEKGSVETKRFCSMLIWTLEMPLYLPRRLTIPIACKDRWSKPMAVVSVSLAPILLSVIWDLQDDKISVIAYGIGCLFGLSFGVLACLKTQKSSPPQKCLFPWLAGGFIMSVIWSYIIAQELVGLLVSLGYILGISHSILGLTALAWGNSLGDLITNLTMALNGGPKGAQVALSGCYAGPIFNMLFGLGLSLVGSTWYGYPSPMEIPRDPYLFETLGFLVAALLWTILVLPIKDMRLDGVLGGGLFLIYFTSMSLRLVQVVGPLQLHTIS
ncbi:Cation/calcium exchanger 2 [Hibiscus syriacus]|uniref:Cation/calcium exchanger 2 n=1 Tax=Hibiscus syriacus TaxID=106335 RepID=A0A6A3BUD0_HIBSY|nr:cation/calcium exchanger 2-like [Hibiscus syriacus]KAE8720450.1 Cation/calcium exchanger 2 [Hibiscus syriacus]